MKKEKQNIDLRILFHEIVNSKVALGFIFGAMAFIVKSFLDLQMVKYDVQSMKGAFMETQKDIKAIKSFLIADEEDKTKLIKYAIKGGE